MPKNTEKIDGEAKKVRKYAASNLFHIKIMLLFDIFRQTMIIFIVF